MRHWIQAEQTGPHEFDSVLVSILAFDRYGNPTLVGTGFIIGCTPDTAVVLTAAHNFELVEKGQFPWTVAHASSPFSPGPLQRLTLDSKQFRLLYRDGDKVELCIGRHANLYPGLDIAVLVITQERAVEAGLFRNRVNIDTAPPVLGREIFMMSYGHVKPSVVAEEADMASVTVGRTVYLRKGVITGVHPNGIRMVKAPCFETSIPVDPGMSGGFFAWPGNETDQVTVCGVVSADFSDDAAKASFLVPGCSIGTMLWPAMSLRLPNIVLPGETEPREQFLRDLIPSGFIRDVNNGAGKIHIEILEGDKTEVTYLPPGGSPS